MSISHSGSKAQCKGDTRNRVLYYLAFMWASGPLMVAHVPSEANDVDETLLARPPGRVIGLGSIVDTWGY